MSSVSKQRFLNLLSTGIFANLSPERLENLYHDVRLFMLSSASTLDTADLYDMYELQFYLLLLSNRDVEAKLFLDRINDLLAGKKSQKLAVLQSMYWEAVADDDTALRCLRDDPNELRASRRLMALSRRNKDREETIPTYIKSLNFYLKLQACDTLVWAELGDTYRSIGEYEKAVHCYKEVLLQEPAAYNMFYKAGLSLYYQLLKLMAGKASRKELMLLGMQTLEHSRDCFLRAVEISESYTKGWVGAYIVSGSDFLVKLREDKASSGVAAVERFLMETEKIHQLSKERIMALEHLATDEELEAFLQQ